MLSHEWWGGVRVGRMVGMDGLVFSVRRWGVVCWNDIG